MKFTPLSLEGSFSIDLSPYEDERGRFTRILCMRELASIGHDKKIVQVNCSFTKKKGAIRGMHFQYPPRAEIKMVTCLHGRVFDVIIDIRQGSPTFLQWAGMELSETNHRAVYIPEGFAHGFQTLEDNCELIYFHTEFYDKNAEGGLRYNDERIGIVWPLPPSDISDKDRSHKSLTEGFKGISV
jgi:dTDP-4-dehydrorhamnose 3,5-epimerase